LEDLLKLAKERMEENGLNVLIADDIEEARNYILDLVRSSDVVAQSSADLVTEMGLSEALHKKMIPLYHVEPNQRLFQLNPEMAAFDKPSPTRSLKRKEIARILSGSLGREIPDEMDAIFDAWREDVDLIFRKATVGITGANSISATDGSVILCYGTGNITKVCMLPKHIVLAGIEKVVPTFADAIDVTYLQSLYESGTGGSANYFVVKRPSHRHIEGKEYFEGDGAREIHVVLLDNGRRRMIKEGFGEALQCIRCFTCHHYCPTYQILGPGSGYGFTTPGFGYKGYVGGRGTILSFFTYGSQAALEGGLFSCTLCGACRGHCPLEIDVPMMISRLRNQLVEMHSEGI
jgi:L-lactate dehydrogenase complex protein LldG